MISLDFFDTVIEYLQGFVTGFEELVSLGKTIAESTGYLVAWLPQIITFLNTQLITFIPPQLTAVFLVSFAIFVIKIVLGGDT